jgi:intracellular septation protein
MSLFLVVGSSAAALFTHGSRFVMIKSSLTYIIVGIVMLQLEWMNHYLPNLAKAVVPDIAVILGHTCAAHM